MPKSAPGRQIKVMSRLSTQETCKLVCFILLRNIIIILCMSPNISLSFFVLDRCERRKQCRAGSIVLEAATSADTSTTRRHSTRVSKPRNFYAEYACSSTIDECLDNFDYEKYAWHMPQHMGGVRRSKRQVCTDEIKRVASLAVDILGELPFVRLCRDVLQTRQVVTTPTVTTDGTPTTTRQVGRMRLTNNTQNDTVDTPPATAAATNSTSPVDGMKPGKKRRFIQFCYEMMGTPPEFYPNEEPCWEGKQGVISQIRDMLGLHNTRSRKQIRNVLTYVYEQFNNGNVDVDAGVKLNASNSGRKRKLNVEMDRVVAKSLTFGFGLEMTTAIVNHKVGDAHKVCLSTVRNSAKRAFGGKCHNRANKKTGSRDESTPWATGRLGMALQLQQQFRKDEPGVNMVGKRVVKLFDGAPFVGKITAIDVEEEGGAELYHVKYEDGDEEDLHWNELFVDKWTKIDRRQVLWLDEKHKKVVLGAV